MGYTNKDFSGQTELRVHGVSGTPVEEMVEHPHVAMVAGDDAAGFHRRVWESRLTSADDQTSRLEAYSWRGLTSGSWRRALWLLLLPFMMVNVAFHMTPKSPLTDSGGWKRVRRVSEALQRLMALSLTLTLVISVVVATIDLVGWQCGRDTAVCAPGGLLAFLDWSWLDTPGRRLAVTALVPLAAVALLWRLARNTWLAAEAVTVPSAAPRDEPNWCTPLEDRSMWNGGAPVATLRALHVAAALALVGVFLTAPLLAAPHDGIARLFTTSDARDTVAAVLTSAHLLLLAVCAVAVAVPSLTDRERPHESTRHGAGWRQALPWIGLGLLVLAGGLAWWPDQAAPAPASNLPWVSGGLVVTFVVQLSLVGLIAVVCAAQAIASRAPGQQLAGAAGATPVVAPRAWWGMASPVLVAAGWLLAGGLGAALTVRVADVLGTPTATTADPAAADAAQADAILLPMQYFWVALATPVATVAAALVAAFGWYRMGAARAAVHRDRVLPAYQGVYDDTDSEQRARALAIATAWTRSSVSDVASRAVSHFAVLMALVPPAGLLGYLLVRDWPVDSTVGRFLVTVGNLVLTGAILALLYVGRLAYGNPTFRRTVGVVWDIGTFWPRATHPLAPPCYAERTIPDLVRRIEHTRRQGGVTVLSGHSQGSVIGAATIAQLSVDDSAHTALLTYGSPLRRLYARFFPAYFGVDALLRIGELLGSRPGTGPEARGRWPWLNLYRLSDPIGGTIFFGYPVVAAAPVAAEPAPCCDAARFVDVDRQLLDPEFARAAGDGCYPRTHGHSGYFADPAFAAAVHALRCCRRPGPSR